MSWMLLIDTASAERASVGLSKEGALISSEINDVQKDHAAFIHVAIKKLLHQNQLSIQDIDAVAVTAGPGSYTGIRIGMASASGICYAMNIPLIAISSLEVMAMDIIERADQLKIKPAALICPMIDARRVEVFTALYDKCLNIILPEQALILNESSFYTHLEKNQIIFTGNGCIKWKEICKHSNALWIDVSNMLQNTSKIAYFRKNQSNFIPTLKSTPIYLKGLYIEKRYDNQVEN